MNDENYSDPARFLLTCFCLGKSKFQLHSLILKMLKENVRFSGLGQFELLRVFGYKACGWKKSSLTCFYICFTVWLFSYGFSHMYICSYITNARSRMDMNVFCQSGEPRAVSILRD